MRDIVPIPPGERGRVAYLAWVAHPRVLCRSPAPGDSGAVQTFAARRKLDAEARIDAERRHTVTNAPLFMKQRVREMEVALERMLKGLERSMLATRIAQYRLQGMNATDARRALKRMLDVHREIKRAGFGTSDDYEFPRKVRRAIENPYFPALAMAIPLTQVIWGISQGIRDPATFIDALSSAHPHQIDAPHFKWESIVNDEKLDWWVDWCIGAAAAMRGTIEREFDPPYLLLPQREYPSADIKYRINGREWCGHYGAPQWPPRTR